MIGGIVTQVIVLPDRVWINCVEEQSTSKCAIYVERDERSEKVKPADTVWWQGGFAMWTPYEYKQGSGKFGIDYEIKLNRIGFSGVAKPNVTCGPECKGDL